MELSLVTGDNRAVIIECNKFHALTIPSSLTAVITDITCGEFNVLWIRSS